MPIPQFWTLPQVSTEREAKLLCVSQSAGLVWGVQSGWLETCKRCGDAFTVNQTVLSESGETYCFDCFQQANPL